MLCTTCTNNQSFFFFNLILFTFGCAGSLMLHAGFLQLQRAVATFHCGVQASHCSGFSCCGARALGTWAQWLWHVGSVVAAPGLFEHGLSCCPAYGISPNQGSNPCPLHWQADSLTTGPGKPLAHLFNCCPSSYRWELRLQARAVESPHLSD